MNNSNFIIYNRSQFFIKLGINSVNIDDDDNDNGCCGGYG